MLLLQIHYKMVKAMCKEFDSMEIKDKKYILKNIHQLA